MLCRRMSREQAKEEWLRGEGSMAVDKGGGRIVGEKEERRLGPWSLVVGSKAESRKQKGGLTYYLIWWIVQLLFLMLCEWLEKDERVEKEDVMMLV